MEAEITGPDRADVAERLRRAVDRLSVLGEPRLVRAPDDGGPSAVDAAWTVADACAEAVGGPDGPKPPRLHATAAAHVVAVVSRDLLAAWERGAVDPAALDRVDASVRALSRSLGS